MHNQLAQERNIRLRRWQADQPKQTGSIEGRNVEVMELPQNPAGQVKAAVKALQNELTPANFLSETSTFGRRLFLGGGEAAHTYACIEPQILRPQNALQIL